MKAPSRTGRFRRHAAIVVLSVGISGCASLAHPASLSLDHLIPIACRDSRADLQAWPGTHLKVRAPSDQVLAAAWELAIAQGYGISADAPVDGCFQTDFQPVRPSSWESLRSVLGLKPSLTGRSLVVRVAAERDATQASVWGIAKFGQLGLTAGHPSIKSETRRLARAIKRRFGKRH